MKENKSWKLVNFCEFDKFATQSYCAIHNVNENLNLGDITKVNEKEIADFTMMCGGSPCQDFSIAGRQAGAMWLCSDCGHKYNPLEAHYLTRDECPICHSKNIEKTRSSLIVEYLRILREKHPKFALYENVKNIIGKQFKPTFDLFISELNEYGYNTYYSILNAKNYGIPQNRERLYLFIVDKNIDTGKFEFPKPFDNGLRLKDVLEDEVDEKYYLSKQVQDRFQITDETFTKNIVGTTKPEFRTIGQRDLVYQEDSVMGALVATDYKQPKQIIETNRCIQSGNLTGGKWDKIYESARRYYSTEGVSPTLHTCGGGNTETKIIEDQTYIDNISDEFSFAKRKAQQMLDKKGKLPEMFNPYNNYEVSDYAPIQTACCDRSASTATVLKKDGRGFIRKLTPKECYRLMGFSDEAFNKAAEKVSNTQLYRQAGNSIVTTVLFHIYNSIYDVMPYLFDNLTLTSLFSGIGAFEVALDMFFSYRQENSEYVYTQLYKTLEHREIVEIFRRKNLLNHKWIKFCLW